MSRRGFVATRANKRISFPYIILCAELRQCSWHIDQGSSAAFKLLDLASTLDRAIQV